MNTRPLTSPPSTARTALWRRARAASSPSSGRARSRAKWLRVPIGRMARGVDRPTRADAAAATLPSPPHAITTSAPSSAALRAAFSISPPSSLTTSGSYPEVRSASTSLSSVRSAPSSAKAPAPLLSNTAACVVMRCASTGSRRWRDSGRCSVPVLPRVPACLRTVGEESDDPDECDDDRDPEESFDHEPEAEQHCHEQEYQQQGCHDDLPGSGVSPMMPATPATGEGTPVEYPGTHRTMRWLLSRPGFCRMAALTKSRQPMSTDERHPTERSARGPQPGTPESVGLDLIEHANGVNTPPRFAAR